jgi:hypothetical protein
LIIQGLFGVKAFIAQPHAALFVDDNLHWAGAGIQHAMSNDWLLFI